MNVTLRTGGSVHANIGNVPACRTLVTKSEAARFKGTDAEVTCKKCLKAAGDDLAAEVVAPVAQVVTGDRVTVVRPGAAGRAALIRKAVSLKW